MATVKVTFATHLKVWLVSQALQGALPFSAPQRPDAASTFLRFHTSEIQVAPPAPRTSRVHWRKKPRTNPIISRKSMMPWEALSFPRLATQFWGSTIALLRSESEEYRKNM